MRTFIKTNLEDIFITVEKNDTQILELIQAKLPTSQIYSRMDKENPFKLYCGYIDFARPT